MVQLISRKSKIGEAVEDTSLDPPEPLDIKEPVLIGRHDVPNVSYEEEKVLNISGSINVNPVNVMTSDQGAAQNKSLLWLWTK